MKTFKYILPSSNIWASFDGGEVEAENAEAALIKAEAEITVQLEKVNGALAVTSNTKGMNIGMDFDNIEVEEVKGFNHAMNMSFTVISDIEDSPSPEEIRTGLQRAFKLCKDDDDELVDRCEIHDTFEIE